ncbi:MHS family MFS transporter [Paracoccus methylovorus]|uniref:MHS family MFS transporter n=2 Tax=Paracoccus TaxID=265 RepID=A0ABX7JM00_9RHOB|nr:MFS transporter [Paracoccus methylovorus]QRZ14824.1 MHS family MFS transporter [Paracoccus methylovorus]
MNGDQKTAENQAVKARRAGIASFVGTTIEWYDFYIYGLAASLVFGDLFFSKNMDPGVATLLSFATFWVGFLGRPVGGVIFGHLGDRIGRKTTLVITLMMMGVATTFIGLLPTYETIGFWAPIGLVILRFIQGVAVGGEWGGAVLIASENAPKGKGVLYSAFAQQGAPAGNLLAISVFFLLSLAETPDFLLNGGWRIPFLLSSVLIVIGMIIRLRIEDSTDVQKLLQENRDNDVQPVREAIKGYWPMILLGAGTLPIIYVTYIKTSFALSWATKSLGYDSTTFLSLISVAVIVQCITQPFGAVLMNRVDMRKAVLLITVPEFFLVPLMFYGIYSMNYWFAMFTMALATIPHGMYYGAIAGILARAFPARVRYSGLSLANQLGALTVGGGTPVLLQFLLNKTGSIVPVAIVSGGYALVSLICVLFVLKRTGTNATELSTAERRDASDLADLAATPAAVVRAAS